MSAWLPCSAGGFGGGCGGRALCCGAAQQPTLRRRASYHPACPLAHPLPTRASSRPQPSDRVLVAEACNHNRITAACNDIGCVQIPGKLRQQAAQNGGGQAGGQAGGIGQQGGQGAGASLAIDHAFGREFPELEEAAEAGAEGSGGPAEGGQAGGQAGGLGRYSLAVHCGGCMIDAQKLRARILDLQVGGGWGRAAGRRWTRTMHGRVLLRPQHATWTPHLTATTSTAAGGGRARHQLRPAAQLRRLARRCGARAQAVGPVKGARCSRPVPRCAACGNTT